MKLHTLLGLRGSIPSFIEITDGKVHDINILDTLIHEAGSFYVMDRGYLDFARLYLLHQAQAFFVIRATEGVNENETLSTFNYAIFAASTGKLVNWVLGGLIHAA